MFNDRKLPSVLTTAAYPSLCSLSLQEGMLAPILKLNLYLRLQYVTAKMQLLYEWAILLTVHLPGQELPAGFKQK